MSRHLRTVMLLVSLLSVAAPVATAAQGLERGEIRGSIRDETGGVLARAEVTLTSPALIGGPRTQATTERGEYLFGTLLPGTYTLQVRAPGFSPATFERIEVTVGSTARLDVTLTLAGVIAAENVSVVGPLVDVDSPALATTIDEGMLQGLPIARNIGQILTLAPGMFGPSPVPGLVVAHGGTIGSNGLYLDGVDITEPRRQAAWLPVNYNWLQQVRIDALAAGVEHGGFTGAVASAVTRSGGNTASWLVEYWTTHWKWVDRNGSSLAGREVLALWDASWQLGGPIQRDRFWFFTGLEFFRNEDRPLNYTGPSRAHETPRAVLKLTRALGADTRLEGHLHKNWSTTTGANAGPFTAADALSEVRQSDVSWNVKLTKVFNVNTLLAVRSGGYHSHRTDGPASPRSRLDPAPIFDGSILRANSSGYSDTRPQLADLQATVSRRYDGGRAGTHQFDAGFESHWGRSRTEQGFPGGQRLFYSNGSLATVTNWTGDHTEASTRRNGFHLQDQWHAADRLTITAGLRTEFYRGRIPSGETVLSANPISPRVGAVWALDGSATSAVKAHYGRYFDALMAERVAFMDVPGIGTTVGYSVNASGELTEVFRSAPPTARAIDAKIRQSFVDQFVVGYERRLFAEMMLQTAFVHRRFDDSMAMTDTGSRWEPVELRDPGEDGMTGTADDAGTFTAYRLTNPGQQFLLFTNPADGFRRYSALQVVIARRWAGAWLLQGSYTAAKTTGTVGNGDFTNAGLNDTGHATGSRTTSAFMNPNAGINANGRAPYDKHEFKVLGVYRVPLLGGLDVSGILWRQGGNRWERLIIYTNTLIPGTAQTVRLEPRGSRSTSPIWNLDLRVEPAVRVPFMSGRLGLAFDIFNATNQGTPLAVDAAVGRNFGAPITRSDPRSLRVLLRWTD